MYVHLHQEQSLLWSCVALAHSCPNIATWYEYKLRSINLPHNIALPAKKTHNTVEFWIVCHPTMTMTALMEFTFHQLRKGDRDRDQNFIRYTWRPRAVKQPCHSQAAKIGIDMLTFDGQSCWGGGCLWCSSFICVGRVHWCDGRGAQNCWSWNVRGQ